MTAIEINFDGLVGPTHHYAGLAIGNRASAKNAHAVSDPRAAARQGLAKMKALTDLGVPQAVLPPHERPDVASLRGLGFAGADAEVLARARAEAPDLLAAAASASSMWAANAATVSASADCADRRVHFTPANLCAHFHRAIETPTTARVLARIFADDARFVHHAPLPSCPAFADEGAANHTRLTAANDRGVGLFVYGRDDAAPGAGPKRFPARQSRQASLALARQHGLDPSRTVFARQNPSVIDAGVFHNDVIAVGQGQVMFCHAQAFADQAGVRRALETALGERSLRWIEAPSAAVDVATAVDTYLFNSQLVCLPDGTRALIVPGECRESASVRAYLDSLVANPDVPIDAVHVIDVKQSMKNGGGPACLRLRVPLTAAERAAAAPGVFFDEALYDRLYAWVDRYYRDRLRAADLADPDLLDTNRRALDELTVMLGLGPIYNFQRYDFQRGDTP